MCCLREFWNERHQQSFYFYIVHCLSLFEMYSKCEVLYVYCLAHAENVL